jgi:predicted peptidase
MTPELLLSGIVVLTALFGPQAVPEETDPDAGYQLGTESQRQEGVPEGIVTKHEWTSQVFEGTLREYFVYVPRQYDGTQPACLMVFQDGHAYVDPEGQFRVPIVFDNLIHAGAMPVTIGLFINPGHRGDSQPDNRWRANNRSFEYDTLSDQYAQFVIQELLPHIAEEMKLNISDNAQDRAIGGISSGGICAFTAAWEHPEWFSKVLSHVGSFTNIRGGHHYQALIRKTERKPLRVFLQDGENDLNNEHGNWWLSNLQMENSLKFKNYDHQFVGGIGGHNGKHGGAILPESLKWLWKDHVVGKADSPSEPVSAADVFESRSIRFTGGDYKDEQFDYRLLKPTIVSEGTKYPLVIFLHGAGERGTDNALQLLYFPTQMAQPHLRERFPCYVLAPQCRPDQKWVDVDWASPADPAMPEVPSAQLQAVMQMIEETLKTEAIDPDRVYLTGLSMGGFGTFDLAIRKPEWFAAVAPICGAADPKRVTAIQQLPMWITHGADDQVVPVERSRSAVEAIRAAGGRPVYVELPGIGHNSWTPAHEDPDGLIPWLFRQSR